MNRGERPRVGGAHAGWQAAPRVHGHLGEVSERLRLILFITRRRDDIGDLGVCRDEMLDVIDGLAGWAAIHLAVVREHGEAV